MKRLLLLVAAFLGISVGSAQAVCTPPAVMHDFPGTSFNMSLATAPDGNCASNNAITTWGGVTLGAPSNYGTSPGAVAVPGVNAFITNQPTIANTTFAATQSGTWTVQQGTPPWSVSVASSTPEGGLTDAPATLPASTSSASMIALLKALANTGQYPSGATAITASTTGTTAATTATLAAAVGKTTYICSLSIRANAAAAATGNATVTGTITGTLNYTQWTAPNASGVGITEQIFNPCIPASATNTGIAVISAAPGTSGVVSVAAAGYQL